MQMSASGFGDNGEVALVLVQVILSASKGVKHPIRFYRQLEGSRRTSCTHERMETSSAMHDLLHWSAADQNAGTAANFQAAGHSCVC